MSPLFPCRGFRCSLAAFAAGSLVLLLVGCGGDSSSPVDPDPDPRVASSIELDLSEVSVDDAASVRVTATVRDQHGQAFSSLPQGTSVTWSVSQPTIASVQAVAGSLQADVTGEHPGQTQVNAAIAGQSAQLAVTVHQVPTQLVLVAGDEQEGPAESLLGQDLVVRVVDRHDSGVPGIEVAFSVASGGGVLAHESALTDADGYAENQWTLGSVEGEQTVRAQVQGLGGSPLEYRATAIPQVATGTVAGVVTAANGTMPIQGALVRLADTGAGAAAGAPAQSYEGPEALTDAEGRYVLENVPEGDQLLVATRGVFSAEIPVTVVAGVTVEAETLALDASGRLAYVEGDFDAIQDIVRDELGTELDRLTGPELASAEITSRYRLIFINCGVWDWDYDTIMDVVENLRNYVAEGGALYMSDLELPLLEFMFPDDVEGDGGGDEGTITAQVVSSELRAFIPGSPATVQIGFNLSGWDAVTGMSSRPEVLLQADYQGWTGQVQDGPLAIALEHGDGQVVYTSFHNNAVATSDQVAVLMYFIYGFGDAGAAGVPAVDLSRRGVSFQSWVAGRNEAPHSHRSRWPERP